MTTDGARTEQQLNEGISLLMEQIEVLQHKSLDAEMQKDGVRLKVVVSSFRNAISEIFGRNSPEYREYGALEMFGGPLRVGITPHELHQARVRGRDHMVAVASELIQRLQRKLRLLANRTVVPSAALHPKIAAAIGDLVVNGHPWEAVFAACKALILHVKDRSGRHDLDGVPLMRQVFSKNTPILRFNAQASSTDGDEQEGMMHLYEGVIMALRNPGGHAFPTGSEGRALQYLGLISMLAERADEATLSP